MADFRNRAGGAGGDSLDAIARTDQLLDALAAERRVQPADAGEAELFALLGGWRDEVRWPPATDLVSERDAAAALRDGVNSTPVKRGGHRGLTIVASLAAAVLCLGGFGAVVGTAGPGDPLYGVRTALFGEGKEVRGDQVALASAQMAQVQQLISQGDWAQAQEKLQAVSTQVQAVDDVSTKADLIQQWNELSIKVGTRDPAATLPPVEPGVPPVEPPPGVTLLEMPSLTTTTASSSEVSTPPSDTTTSTTLSTSETAPTSESSTTTQPSASQSPTSATPTTSELPTTTSAVEAPAPAVTTTTSSAPQTGASSTSTTQSQAQQALTTTTTTTTTTTAAQAAAPAPSSVPTTTAAPRAAESQPAAAPAAPTDAQTAPQRAPDVVTTTMPRPILQLPLLGGN